MEDRLTLQEAAALLNLHPHTLRRHIYAGRLAAEKPGGRDIFIRRAELERFQRDRPRAGWQKGRPRKPTD